MASADLSIRSRLIANFHRLIFAIYLFSIYYDTKYVIPDPNSTFGIYRNSFGGRFKYLTILNVIFLQFGFFTLAFLSDTIGTNSKKPTVLQKVCDVIFTTLVFPVGLFVTATFWGIYAFDRELIFPKEIDAWFPVWLNHCYHTLPLVAAVLETVLVEHKYPKGFAAKWGPLLTVYTAYIAWIFYVAYVGNFWIYPIFEALNPVWRTTFILFLSLVFIFFLKLGEAIKNFIWGGKSYKKKKDRSPARQSKENKSPSKKYKKGYRPAASN